MSKIFSTKPRIGILAIMQELYDESYPDIVERQEKFVSKIIKRFDSLIEIKFISAARNRNDIESHVSNFNESNLDGIMIIMLTYSPGLRLLHALQKNNLPILLANIQPEESVSDYWDMSDLTFNQGVHGAQDTANTIARLGIKASFVSDNWRSSSFLSFITDWSYASKTRAFLKKSKFASIGQMPEMGDILTDSSNFMKIIGPQIDQVSIGKIHQNMQKITNSEVELVIKENARNFNIDKNINSDSYIYAVRLQCSIERLLLEEGYDGFSIYFGLMSDDKRFKQLHMMAASNLMAKNYGYAAEGDMCCSALVSAGHCLIGQAHFTEMYAMDFKRNSILQSHMGEGNWKIARKDKPVLLVNRKLDIGGLDNPPTVVFMGEPGPATMASIVSIGCDYHLVTTEGNIMDTNLMPNVDMPYFHFKPKNGVKKCLDGWLSNAGTHHQCLNIGLHTRRWRILCQMIGIKCISV